MSRPPFIIATGDVLEKSDRYPNRHESLGHGRAIGQAAGLLKIGLHVVRFHLPSASSATQSFCCETK